MKLKVPLNNKDSNGVYNIGQLTLTGQLMVQQLVPQVVL